MSLLDILKQYTTPGAAPMGDLSGHFDSVAQQAAPSQLGAGIKAALRSDATPACGQTIGNLFGQSNPDQKAGLLTELNRTLGPGAAATAGGGILGKLLGASSAVTGAAITPTQAAQVSPSDLSTLATSAQHTMTRSLIKLAAFMRSNQPWSKHWALPPWARSCRI